MQPEPNRKYTFADYQTLESDERWELIDGELCAMGAPTLLHQGVSGELFGRLWQHFSGKPCRVFAAPLAVKLSESDVVQPDLLVVCRPEIMLPSHVDGAPDLAVEILSPSTQRQDRLRKLNLYARLGVKEYWLVTPYPFMIEVLRHREGLFEVAGVYSEGHTLRSFRFPELVLDLAAIHAALPYTDEMREPQPAYSTF